MILDLIVGILLDKIVDIILDKIPVIMIDYRQKIIDLKFI